MHGLISDGVVRRIVPHGAGEERAAAALVELGAGVERIEDHRRPGGVVAGDTQQEVPGERDALDVEPGAARHVHVDDRQRDGNPEAPLEDDVEEAVAEVVVVGAIAEEALAIEEQAVERGDALAHRRRPDGPEIDGGQIAQARELGERGPRIEPRILEPRDHQGGARDVDGRLRERADQFVRDRIRVPQHAGAGSHAIREAAAAARPASRSSTSATVTSSSEATTVSASPSADAA